MFEKQIEKVYQGILSRIDASNPNIYLRDIVKNPRIGEAYVRYVNAEVSWWVYEERMQRENAVNFNIDTPEIVALFDQLDSQYINSAFFDHDGLKLLINSAVKTRLNMLVRPRTTLKWFIFRGEPTKPYIEILKRLDYFQDYSYLIDNFKKWVSEKGVIRRQDDILSVVEFSRIIEQIDNDRIFDLSPEEFVALLEPIYAFFNYGAENDEYSTIPTEALMIFLDDKGIAPVLNKLEILYHQDLASITRGYLLDFLYRIMEELESEATPESTAGEIRSEHEIDHAPVFNLPKIDLPDINIGLEESNPELESEPETEAEELRTSGLADTDNNLGFVPSEPVFEYPVEEEFAETPVIEQPGTEEIVENTEPVEEKAFEEQDDNPVTDESVIIPESEQPADEILNEYLPDNPIEVTPEISGIQEEFEPTHENQSVDEMPSVQEKETESPSMERFPDDLIEENKKQEFILNMFMADENLLEILLDQIKACNDWEGAKKVLNEYYGDAGVDPSSLLVLEFEEIIKNRF